MVGDRGLSGLQVHLELLLYQNLSQDIDRLRLLRGELPAQLVQCWQDAAVREVDADGTIDVGEDRNFVGGDPVICFS